MNVRTSGSFAMMLVTGSFVAIPLMVMFGLPRFASLTASTEPDSDEIVRQPFSEVLAPDVSPAGEFATAAQAPARGGMLPVLSQPPQALGRAPRPSPLRGPPPLVGHRQSDQQHRHAAPISPSRVPTSLIVPSEDGAMAPPSIAAGSPSSWENAAQQLHEMGIDDYRLERGHNGESYLFICQFAPGGDARIIRRFEAEAAEPFDAVQQVLTQIGHWRERMDASPSLTP